MFVRTIDDNIIILRENRAKVLYRDINGKKHCKKYYGNKEGLEITEKDARYLVNKNYNECRKILKPVKKLIYKEFNQKYDKCNKPYINHLLRVANKCKKMDSRIYITALLHDTFEDTNIDKDDLIKLKVPDEIIKAVEKLTKLSEVTYVSYIKNLSDNYFASIVKLADLNDNMDKKRIWSGYSVNLRKYKRAYAFLINKIKKVS